MKEPVHPIRIPGRAWLSRMGAAAVNTEDSEELRLRKSLLMFASGLMNVAAVIWLLIYWRLGLDMPTSIPLAYQTASVIVLAIYLRTRNFDFFRVAQLSLFLFFPFAIQWSVGSFVSSSGIALLALLAPIGAMVCFGPRQSIPWFVAYVVMTIMSGIFDFYLSTGSEAGIPMRTIAVFFVLNFTIISTMVYLLLRFFMQERERFQARLDAQHRLVEIERGKSERLLLNILPGHVAQRLKEQPGNLADGFADVTVMFADLVGFTRMSQVLTPAQVVEMLDEVFTLFDKLAEKHRLDKIKTIGDAYMVVGGLTRNDKQDHVVSIADMALEMLNLTRGDSPLWRMGLNLHIGIATGPAVAGVIGTTRFIYDVWGDTVNMASRLTSEAVSGVILVDTATRERLGMRFVFEPPQDMEIKGKGIRTVFRLTESPPFS
ncbi:MAG: adenylate/guanylate cyclase domain-containing protein [Burkholderiales bacterium]